MTTHVTNHIALTEDEFIDRYRPEQTAAKTYYRQREWSDPQDEPEMAQAARERRLWTALDDDDGDFCICEGNHLVNRLFYVITEVPYGEHDSVVVQDADVKECIVFDLIWDVKPEDPDMALDQVAFKLDDMEKYWGVILTGETNSRSRMLKYVGWEEGKDPIDVIEPGIEEVMGGKLKAFTFKTVDSPDDTEAELHVPD